MVDLTRAWTEVIVDHGGLAEYGLPTGKLMVTRVRECHLFEYHTETFYQAVVNLVQRLDWPGLDLLPDVVFATSTAVTVAVMGALLLAGIHLVSAFQAPPSQGAIDHY